ncbi:hypothetical protein [Flavobacterium sp.]
MNSKEKTSVVPMGLPNQSPRGTDDTACVGIYSNAININIESQ